MKKDNQSNTNGAEKQETWFRRNIKVFGVDAPVMMIMGVLIGILLSIVFMLSIPDLFVQPLIANAVRATVAALPTPAAVVQIEPPQTSGSTSPGDLTPDIDPMDNAANWNGYTGGTGAMDLGLVTGETNQAIAVTYTLNEHDYVGIEKKIIPCQLFGTRGIRFSYNGSGASSTLEIKFIYTPDDLGQEAVFSLVLNSATDTGGQWLSMEADYSEFQCWPDTGCSAMDVLDVSRVARIDFAISNKPDKGDMPGTGIMLIDNVQTIR